MHPVFYHQNKLYFCVRYFKIGVLNKFCYCCLLYCNFVFNYVSYCFKLAPVSALFECQPLCSFKIIIFLESRAVMHKSLLLWIPGAQNTCCKLATEVVEVICLIIHHFLQVSTVLRRSDHWKPIVLQNVEPSNWKISSYIFRTQNLNMRQL